MTVQDEGSALASQPAINFIGAGVTAANNAGASRIDVTIPGGGASPTTTEGDVIVRGASADQRLAVGSNGQVLTVDTAVSGKLKYATPLSSPTTTEGDLIVRGASADQRLGIGTTGQVLTVDTSVSGKTKWAAAASGGAIGSLTLSAFDALSGNGGYSVVYISDGLITAVWNGSSWDYYFGSQRVYRPPTSGWTNLNVGGAGESVSLATGAIKVNANSTSGNSVRLTYRTAPSAPYSAYFCCYSLGGPGGSMQMHCGWRDSSNSKLHTMAIHGDNTLEVNRWTNETTFSSADASNYAVGTGDWFSPMWIRLDDDNTNLKFNFGTDRFSFRQIVSVSRTAFLSSPNQLFFGISPITLGVAVTGTLISFNTQ